MPMHFLLRYILFREHASTSPPQASRGSPVALPWPSRDTPDGPPVTLPMAWTPRNSTTAEWAANAKAI